MYTNFAYVISINYVFFVHNYLINKNKYNIKMEVIEEQYWEQRYSFGGNSGLGSIGKDRDWKWFIIDKYVPKLKDVLDVGCGDLSFWEERSCLHYVGIDISKIIIKKNYNKRPDWKFIWSNAENRIEGLNKEVVFCFDLLFHIMNEKSFLEILLNLCYYSTNFIFIHTWGKNPFNKSSKIRQFKYQFKKFKFKNAFKTFATIINSRKNTDEKYQYFRPLEKYFYIFEDQGFKLIERINNPNKIGTLYVFKRS